MKRRVELKEHDHEKNDVDIRFLRNRGQRDGGKRYASIRGDKNRDVDVADDKD